ncbi:hypothetical protein Ciccas_006886 [Cichlidogyrus casuarinus]|uniref:Uncharacterized protein n=1 Tax=Cichlidogyrus casuarinus TaxID=1844966 RepID=A0ABD2Q4J8_9PLAT
MLYNGFVKLENVTINPKALVSLFLKNSNGLFKDALNLPLRIRKGTIDSIIVYIYQFKAKISGVNLIFSFDELDDIQERAAVRKQKLLIDLENALQRTIDKKSATFGPASKLSYLQELLVQDVHILVEDSDPIYGFDHPRGLSIGLTFSTLLLSQTKPKDCPENLDHLTFSAYSSFSLCTIVFEPVTVAGALRNYDQSTKAEDVPAWGITGTILPSSISRTYFHDLLAAWQANFLGSQSDTVYSQIIPSSLIVKVDCDQLFMLVKFSRKFNQLYGVVPAENHCMRPLLRPKARDKTKQDTSSALQWWHYAVSRVSNCNSRFSWYSMQAARKVYQVYRDLCMTLLSQKWSQYDDPRPCNLRNFLKRNPQVLNILAEMRKLEPQLDESSIFLAREEAQSKVACDDPHLRRLFNLQLDNLEQEYEEEEENNFGSTNHVGASLSVQFVIPQLDLVLFQSQSHKSLILHLQLQLMRLNSVSYSIQGGFKHSVHLEDLNVWSCTSSDQQFKKNWKPKVTHLLFRNPLSYKDNKLPLLVTVAEKSSDWSGSFLSTNEANQGLSLFTRMLQLVCILDECALLTIYRLMTATPLRDLLLGANDSVDTRTESPKQEASVISTQVLNSAFFDELSVFHKASHTPRYDIIVEGPLVVVRCSQLTKADPKLVQKDRHLVIRLGQMKTMPVLHYAQVCHQIP